MIYISDNIIDAIIKEDMPYSDITMEMLGIEHKKGKIFFNARNKGVVSGVFVAVKIFEKLGGKVDFYLHDGEKVKEGDLILASSATAGILHAGWKAALNSLEYLSGISSLCNEMVEKSRKINPNTVVKAYSLLINDGLITSINKKGYLVIYSNEDKKQQYLDQTINKLKLEGYTKQELIETILEEYKDDWDK